VSTASRFQDAIKKSTLFDNNNTCVKMAQVIANSGHDDMIVSLYNAAIAMRHLCREKEAPLNHVSRSE
jgi:hypothetical protein